jgi:4-diphosphocytidyl-2-C-methyl-D-erythritol kinase
MELGSDCGFFIEGVPSLVSGRGEEIRPVSYTREDCDIVIVKPELYISTAKAYAGVKPKVPETGIEAIISSPVESWKGLLKNDFEHTVFAAFPELKQIKERLYDLGAFYASMTGSGSAIYGLFRLEHHREFHFPGCFIWRGTLL